MIALGLVLYVVGCWWLIACLTSRSRHDRALATARKQREAREVERAVQTVLRRVK